MTPWERAQAEYKEEQQAAEARQQARWDAYDQEEAARKAAQEVEDNKSWLVKAGEKIGDVVDSVQEATTEAISDTVASVKDTALETIGTSGAIGANYNRLCHADPETTAEQCDDPAFMQQYVKDVSVMGETPSNEIKIELGAGGVQDGPSASSVDELENANVFGFSVMDKLKQKMLGMTGDDEPAVSTEKKKSI